MPLPGMPLPSPRTDKAGWSGGAHETTPGLRSCCPPLGVRLKQTGTSAVFREGEGQAPPREETGSRALGCGRGLCTHHQVRDTTGHFHAMGCRREAVGGVLLGALIGDGRVTLGPAVRSSLSASRCKKARRWGHGEALSGVWSPNTQ